MNVPAIAKKTFDELQHLLEYSTIVQNILQQLSTMSDALERARFIHQQVDQQNKEVFDHPLVKQLSPCKLGCSACCHTQVSVTDDEAKLLADRIQNGLEIDELALRRQMNLKNNSEAFFKMSYEDRKCVFLDGSGACKVYEDRPSVCRTNAVLGSASQCGGEKNGKMLLVKTPGSDMVIYASYLNSVENGALPFMLGKILGKKKGEP